MTELFDIGENNMATLNKVWLTMIPEFRRLLARDKGGPGDGSGKYKKQAQREFTFIYLMYDFRSPYENWATHLREEQSLKDAGIERGRMMSDGDLWAAISKYKKLLDEASISLKSYRKHKNSAEDLDNYIEHMDLTERTQGGAKVYSVKEKQEAINGMPKVHETLRKWEQSVKEELSGETGLRGEAEKGEDEDPDEDD